jgi:hypothetical protein
MNDPFKDDPAFIAMQERQDRLDLEMRAHQDRLDEEARHMFGIHWTWKFWNWFSRTQDSQE